jgi:hypothetical protein
MGAMSERAMTVDGIVIRDVRVRLIPVFLRLADPINVPTTVCQIGCPFSNLEP